MSNSATQTTAKPSRLREYYELTKPRVVMLIVFTAIVGMFLATPGLVPLDAFVFGMSGLLYLAGTLILDGIFLYYAVRLKYAPLPGLPMRTFGFSIVYLMGIFTLLLIDHYILIRL